MEEDDDSNTAPTFLSGGIRGFDNLEQVIEKRKIHYRKYPIPGFGNKLMKAITEDPFSNILHCMTDTERVCKSNCDEVEAGRKGIYYNAAIVSNMLNKVDPERCAPKHLNIQKYHIGNIYNVEEKHNYPKEQENVKELKISEPTNTNNKGIRGVITTENGELRDILIVIPHIGDYNCRCSVKTDKIDCNNFGALLLNYGKKKKGRSFHTHRICYDCFRNVKTDLNIMWVWSPIITLLKSWNDFRIIDNEYYYSCCEEDCREIEKLSHYYIDQSNGSSILEHHSKLVFDYSKKVFHKCYCEQHFFPSCLFCGRVKQTSPLRIYFDGNMCDNCKTYMIRQKEKRHMDSNDYYICHRDGCDERELKAFTNKPKPFYFHFIGGVKFDIGNMKRIQKIRFFPTDVYCKEHFTDECKNDKCLNKKSNSNIAFVYNSGLCRRCHNKKCYIEKKKKKEAQSSNVAEDDTNANSNANADANADEKIDANANADEKIDELSESNEDIDESIESNEDIDEMSSLLTSVFIDSRKNGINKLRKNDIEKLEELTDKLSSLDELSLDEIQTLVKMRCQEFNIPLFLLDGNYDDNVSNQYYENLYDEQQLELTYVTKTQAAGGASMS